MNRSIDLLILAWVIASKIDMALKLITKNLIFRTVIFYLCSCHLGNQIFL